MKHLHLLDRVIHPLPFARRDFWLLESSIWLHFLAYSLVSIFIPVIMYQAGYSIQQLVWYYFLYNVFDVPLNFVAAYFIRIFGSRTVIILGTIAAIGFVITLLGLQTAPVSTLVLCITAALAAIYDTLYWVAHLFLFMQSDTEEKHAGKNTGVLYGMRIAGGMVGPIVGAGVLTFFGPSALSWSLVVLFGASLIPLVLMQHSGMVHTPQLSFMQFFEHAKGRQAFVSKALYNLHDSIEHMLFPLLIFTLFGTLSSIAFIPAIASLAAIVVSVGFGSIARDRRSAVIIGGSLAIAIVWIARLLFPVPTFFYISILVAGIFAQMVLVPIDAEIFEYGHETHDQLSASTYRNVTDMLSNALLYGVLVLLMQVFSAGFAIAFLSLIALAIARSIFHWTALTSPLRPKGESSAT